MAEADAWRSIHSMRSALHLMNLADKSHIYGKAGPASISDMEAYLHEATKALTHVLKAYYAIREGVRLWREEDNKEGAGEYVI